MTKSAKKFCLGKKPLPPPHPTPKKMGGFTIGFQDQPQTGTTSKTNTRFGHGVLVRHHRLSGAIKHEKPSHERGSGRSGQGCVSEGTPQMVVPWDSLFKTTSKGVP